MSRRPAPRRYRTIDAHAAGEPLRLIVEGYSAPAGRTMLEKRAWAARHADHVRRALMLEPRGHADMYGAVLTEPVTGASDAGVLFMHNEGYSTMCGHGIIAATTIALERGLIHPRRAGEIVFDTPAGPVRARAAAEARGDGAVRVAHVAFDNVPSFVLAPGLELKARGRSLRADIAFGGAFYAIVDAESAGVPITGSRLADLRGLGMEIARAAEAAVPVVHPLEKGLKGIYGTIFTGPPGREDADLRNVTIFADAEVDRSPCGTGTCAVMAVLADMGLLPEDRAFGHESVIGTLFRGRVAGRTRVGGFDAILPEIEGSAWITGEHVFLIDDDDPLRAGFRL
ncbi:MAG TPA: proline racemase family protein [Vicinamibacterales bacterium]|nr:proline racemase family protein [Vicinamibacterales bacterium]HPW19282.1 proline racemase family protein [Vicinamibacterales bacterium]